MSGNSTKAVLSALGANSGIALSKTVAAYFTGSGSLMAESLHSWADCTNQILLLVGMKQAEKAPDVNHPMGYAKVAYFWSMMVAIILFALSGVFAIYEGVERFLHPHPVEYIGISIAVLAIAVVLETFSLRSALKESAAERGNQSLLQWFKTTRQTELLVVTAEDIGALGGLVIALVALILTLTTGNMIFDAIGTVIIGLLMVYSSYMVVSEVKAMITGESIGAEKEKELRAFIEAQPEVKHVINLITIQWGRDIMVATKAEMTETGSEKQLIENISAVEERMQEKFNIKWSFFEPDIK